jgi:hypothetical protein
MIKFYGTSTLVPRLFPSLGMQLRGSRDLRRQAYPLRLRILAWRPSASCRSATDFEVIRHQPRPFTRQMIEFPTPQALPIKRGFLIAAKRRSPGRQSWADDASARYCAVRPPSTASAWPTMNEASSEARNRAARAISSGSPTLPIERQDSAAHAAGSMKRNRKPAQSLAH